MCPDQQHLLHLFLQLSISSLSLKPSLTQLFQPISLFQPYNNLTLKPSLCVCLWVQLKQRFEKMGFNGIENLLYTQMWVI